jgi:hypothetical protein
MGRSVLITYVSTRLSPVDAARRSFACVIKSKQLHANIPGTVKSKHSEEDSDGWDGAY